MFLFIVMPSVPFQLSFSPTSMSWAYGKVLFLLATIVGLCKGLIVLCCYMGALQDWNVFLFTISEVILKGTIYHC